MAKDSVNGPLLLVKRYAEHEKYLNDIGFNGNIRDEIARYLGVSIQQADRYKSLGKCIPEVQALVAEDKLGLSTATYITPLDIEEQHRFYSIMLDAVQDPDMKGIITRTQMPKMIKYFKMGSESWEAIKSQLNQEKNNQSPLPTADLNVGSNNDQEKAKDKVRKNFKQISANANDKVKVGSGYKEQHNTASDNVSASKKRKDANDLIRTMKKLESSLINKHYDFEDNAAVVQMAMDLKRNLDEYIINPLNEDDK